MDVRSEKSKGCRRFLKCEKCGRRIENCSSSELVHYASSGWPKCCGEVMVLVIEAKRSGPNHEHRPGQDDPLGPHPTFLPSQAN